MAIFHCSLRVFSRAEGHSAVAAAAYRAGMELRDERRGFTHRYQHRKGVVKSFILAPPTAPENTYNRAQLWNAAETAETRKNSRVAREIILALPHELTPAAREAVVRDMAQWLVNRYHVAVDTALHRPVDGDGHDKRNHHAHLLFTTREVTKDGMGKKTRVLDDKEKGPQEIELIRSVWETLANDALERAGFSDAKIDRRTLEDQGIDRIPQVHIGPESKAIEERFEDEEDNDKKEDEEDKDGKGKKGKGGNGEGKPPSMNNSAKAGNEGTGHKPDYKKIDQDRSRSDLVSEIKTVNAERAKWSSVPLNKQIYALEQEISRLDTRVKHFERLEAKTSLSGAIRSAIFKAVRFSKEALTSRMERRRALRLTQREQQSRAARQKQRYSKTYRVGIHEQIRNMRTRLDILKDSHSDYQKYQLFVASIEKALAARPIKPAPEAKKARTITNQEFALKLAMKAALARENVSTKHKAAARPSRPSPIKAVIDRATTKAEPQKPTNSPFNQKAQAYKPVKILTREQVRAKSETIVAEIRQNIPPLYKAPPYTQKAPKASKMSAKFNKSAFGGGKASTKRHAPPPP